MARIVPEHVTVRHVAMATEFSITIAHGDTRYARQAAAEAWGELGRIESSLSRYVSYSDVARIGRTPAGGSVSLAADTYDCLQTALQVEASTHGAFNVAYQHQPPRLAAALLSLTDQPPTVRVADDHVMLDLGGIGKGFALDRMATLLADWDLPCFLLRASASTVLAGLPPPGSCGWRVQFGPGSARQQLYLQKAAISGSGLAVKGEHILDPRTGRPATHFEMAWSGAPSAAQADAISTALMVMQEEAIQEFCQRRPDCLAYVLRPDHRQVVALHAKSPEVYR